MRELVTICLLFMLLSVIGSSATPIMSNVSQNEEQTHYDLYPISHTISVGTLKEEQWEHENVTKFNMTSAPGAPGTDYENRTLEGGIVYMAHDNTFLYVLLDSIYCKQQVRLDYGQVAIDSTHDGIGTSNTDMYFFSTFGASHVYFSQQVLYNASINEEDGEVHGFDVSYCHNMPPQGLIPPLQLWGFYQSSWNEETPHEMFSFKIPINNFSSGFPENITSPELPLTVGITFTLYKSITDDPDASPEGGPFIDWPSEANFSDQTTWGTITIHGEYSEPESSPFNGLPFAIIAISITIIIRKKK